MMRNPLLVISQRIDDGWNRLLRDRRNGIALPEVCEMRVIGKKARRGKTKSCLGCPYFDEDGPPGLCSSDVEVLLDRGCPEVGQVRLPREYYDRGPIFADDEEASEQISGEPVLV
ncbi:MAG: hypothetical protein PHH13_05625 [Candidatus Peribacteraceae bacterium]|nr:hypothetical protein [Candidatus Peribacteraceae bacterium]